MSGPTGPIAWLRRYAPLPLAAAAVIVLLILVVRGWEGDDLQPIKRSQVIGSWQPDWDAYRYSLLADPMTADIADSATEQTRKRYDSLRIVLRESDGEVAFAGRTATAGWTLEEPPPTDELTIRWAGNMPLIGRSLRFQRIRRRIHVIFMDDMIIVRLPLHPG